MKDESIPEAPKDIKPIKSWQDWWPGKIGVDRSGNMSGCRSKVFVAMTFEAASEAMNTFFEDNPGLLSTEIQPISGEVREPGRHLLVGFHLLYTKYTSEEEMKAYNRVELKVQELLQAEDAQAAKNKALQEALLAKNQKEASEKAKKEEREKNRLADLGRVHERNCSKKGKT